MILAELSCYAYQSRLVFNADTGMENHWVALLQLDLVVLAA
jgi:hypothetical protein